MYMGEGRLSTTEWGNPLLHVQVRADPRDEWIYVSREGNFVRVWTGDACAECSVELLSVRRCEVHANLVMVGVQCRVL